MVHTSFVLEKKSDRTGDVCKYEPHLVVCRNEEVDYQEQSFSPVAQYYVIKPILRHVIQQGCTPGHIDFQNAFSNRKVERTVYTGMPTRHVVEMKTKGENV